MCAIYLIIIELIMLAGSGHWFDIDSHVSLTATTQRKPVRESRQHTADCLFYSAIDKSNLI